MRVHLVQDESSGGRGGKVDAGMQAVAVALKFQESGHAKRGGGNTDRAWRRIKQTSANLHFLRTTILFLGPEVVQPVVVPI